MEKGFLKYIVFTFFSLFSLYPLSVGVADILELKTLTRSADPIIIAGKDLKGIEGEKIENLRLYAYNDTTLKPVPFQIDERDKNGTYALPSGSEPTCDEEMALDGNDELVFMAGDLGARISKDTLPSGYKDAVEIEILDPVTEKKGWVYVIDFDTPPAASETNKVEYNIEENRIYAVRYIYGIAAGKSYYDYLAIPKSAGGSGENLVDRGKGRVTMKIFGGINRESNEDSTIVELLAYKDGPIRVIRRIKRYMKFLGMKFGSETKESIFYGNQLMSPLDISAMGNTVKKIVKVSIRATTDFSKNAKGMKFYNSNNRTGVLIDGIMSDEEKSMDYGHHEWKVISGEQGTILMSMFVKSEKDIKKNLYYLDDVTAEDSPEEEKGQICNTGYLFDLNAIPESGIEFIINWHFLPSYKPGDEQEYLNILERPLKSTVINLNNL